MRNFYRLLMVVAIVATAVLVSRSTMSAIWQAITTKAETKAGKAATPEKKFVRKQNQSKASYRQWIVADMAKAEVVTDAPNSTWTTPTISAVKTVDKSSALPGDTLSYTVTIRNTGAGPATGLTLTDQIDVNTTTIADSLFYSPVALNDTYESIGNVGITVPAANGVFVNDQKGSPAATLQPTNRTKPSGASINLAADGSFTYIPAAGFTGTDTIQYIIENRVKKDTGILSINVSNMVWFIKNDYTGTTSDGRLNTPFKTIAAFQAINGGSSASANTTNAGHNIFVYESATTYTDAIILRNNQRLIGQDASASLASITGITVPTYSFALPAVNPTANTATLTAASGSVITLNSGNTENTVRGLNIGNRPAAGSGIVGSNFGILTVAEVSINGTGQGIDLTNGTLSSGALASNFGTLSSTSGAFGIRLNNVGGNLIVTSNTSALSGNTTAALFITGNTTTRTITYPGTISSTGAARPVDINSLSNATITLSGNVTGTNSNGINIASVVSSAIAFSGATFSLTTGSNTAINANNNSGGTAVSFSSATKMIKTTTANAVNLVNNTGSSFVFTGGGLADSTTSGIGFNVTGGAASITVEGSNNNIFTTTGTALNIQNSTIGATGLTFKRIDVNGAAKGIALNNTGANGGLTIQGDGTTTAGTGGTIQNTSQRAIEIISAKSLIISNMNLTNANTADGVDAGNCIEIENSGCNAAVYLKTITTNVSINRLAISGTTTEQGINANDVTNLVIENSTIQSAGDGSEEGSLKLKDLKGTCRFENSSFTNSSYRNCHLINTNGTMTLRVTNCNFEYTTAPSGVRQDCFEMRTKSNAVATVIMTGNTFRRAGTKGIQVFADDASNLTLSIANCTIDRMGNPMAGIEVGSDQTATLKANVDGNPIINALNEIAVNVYAGTNSTLDATVRRNPNVSGAGNPGVYQDPTIQAFANQNPNARVLIRRNVINNPDGMGIKAWSNEGTGRLDAVIDSSKVITVPNSDGIWVTAGDGAASPYTNTTCGFVRVDTVQGTPISAFYVESVSGSGSSVTRVLLQGSGPAVTNNWTSNANIGTPVNSTTFNGGTITYSATCALPTNLVAPTIAPPMEDTEGAEIEELKTSTLATETASAPTSNAAPLETAPVQPATPSKALGTLSGGTVTVPSITLPEGKMMIVQFKVRVNESLPASICNVSNTAQVSGSNFATVNSNPAVTNVDAKPVITTCQPNIEASTSTCSSSQAFDIAASGCPARLTKTFKIMPSGTIITSGFAFPVGVTTVKAIASNPAGADSSCTFTVTIKGLNATWTGATNTDWNTASNWNCNAVPDTGTSVTINNTTNKPVVNNNSGAKNITLATGATLTLNAGDTLEVKGDFTSSGTVTANGVFHFSGTLPQTIPGIIYKDVIISGGSTKTLSGAATIDNGVQFNNGKLVIGNNDLRLGTANTITGASVNSFIVTNGSGFVRKLGLGASSGNFTFPVGVSVTSYTPVILNNTGATDNFSVRVITGVYPSYTGNNPASGAQPITSGVVNKTWFINEEVAGGSNVNLTIQWNAGEELTGFDRTSSYVSHNTGSAWLAGPTTGAANGTEPNSYQRTRPNQTSFSPFGVGSTGSVLPAQLLAFKGYQKAATNELEWTVTNESLQKYEIERSASATGFVKVGDVPAGGALGVRQYSWTDNAPLQGANFYRLRLIHPDGSATYSSVINLTRGTGVPMVAVFPTPVKDRKLNLQLSNLEKGNYAVTIFNAGGQMLYNTTIGHAGGSSTELLQLPATITSGMYHLQVRKEGQVFNQNIVVQ